MEDDSQLSHGYGYEGGIAAIREQFPNLNDTVYLDHTGATLYAKSQIQSYHEDLIKNLYGNPHSSCQSSELTQSMIDEVRQEILSFFNTTSDHYYVIFTSSATHGIKLVAENFVFCSGNDSASESCFVYFQDNHTSVVGIRAVALEKGVKTRVVSYEESLQETLELTVQSNIVSECLTSEVKCSCMNIPFNLFAFPAMSNFSGHKYPIEWISSVQNRGPFSNETPGKWFVLFDAATFISTSKLDLSSYHPDFVPISFYKLFGFPTGLGALLVSVRGAEALQSKTYFGGGSVSAYSSVTDFCIPKSSLQDRYKDGTPAFLEILGVRHGFRCLRELTTSMDLITNHTFCLAQYAYNSLTELKHFNGRAVCECYCDTKYTSSLVQGPIVNFNVLRSDGTYVGYAEVSKLANIYRIHLRTGCFCNVGACQHFLNLTTTELQNHFKAGHVCGDSIDIINGRPTGSVRISFGYMSDFSDAEKFLNFIKDCFLQQATNISDGKNETETAESDGVLKRIFIYPVKSCAAFEIKQWNLNEKGLCFDREWLVINEFGSFLSQKREPRLRLVKPCVDLDANILRLQAPEMPEFTLPLDISIADTKSLTFQPRICGAKIYGIDCGDGVSEWLTNLLKQKCRLIRQDPGISRQNKMKQECDDRNQSQALSLVNNSQLVIITEESCLSLLQNIESSTPKQEACDLTLEMLIERFRPNLVISGTPAYEEESWSCVSIGACEFHCCGVCFRCQMISVDPKDGKRSKEPMRTLARLRGSKIPFGVHLLQKLSIKKRQLRVGDNVKWLKGL